MGVFEFHVPLSQNNKMGLGIEEFFSAREKLLFQMSRSRH